ncbi:hypothetical protein HYH03_013345 [Edaphochlamys debaryana]|uniref:Dirigent protein n=1 Tax=Edaphochlamys debaryana TaxID=47281 RepID=A0A835XQZ6_9CHLO|nr:hypothetical protein HYH03_013345 [Edaphochlamys debaryana]|eukprot:KAG2488040.1 hypothetical protein HYH03_013345 [Edaphochlamys debaryana]
MAAQTRNLCFLALVLALASAPAHVMSGNPPPHGKPPPRARLPAYCTRHFSVYQYYDPETSFWALSTENVTLGSTFTFGYSSNVTGVPGSGRRTYGTCGIIAVLPDDSSDAFCQVIVVSPVGTITGAGIVNSKPNSTFVAAIHGGTGIFRGASGQAHGVTLAEVGMQATYEVYLDKDPMC